MIYRVYIARAEELIREYSRQEALRPTVSQKQNQSIRAPEKGDARQEH